MSIVDENSPPSWEVTTLDFLRHGKPHGGEIFRGLTDVALTEEGFSSMQIACDSLLSSVRENDFVTESSEPHWQAVISSPLSRCRDFAYSLCQRHDLPLFLNPNFKEVSFGDWDGVSFQVIKEKNKQAFDDFWREPTKNTPPNGEAFGDFLSRVDGALSNTLSEHRGKHVLVVTHGGVIRAVLNQILEADAFSFMRYEVPYACLTRIRVFHDHDKDFFQLCFHNR